MANATFKTAPHNPPHLFVLPLVYLLTGAIYGKANLMEAPQRKVEWRDAFHEAAKIYEWQIIAWVVLHNHYHAIVRSPELAGSLSKFINSVHKFTARKWNREDQSRGRRVWWNYWDTCIRTDRDYYNRLRYVFWNPVKHQLAKRPEDYSFSNYGAYVAQWQELDFARMDEVRDVPEF